MVHQRSGFCAAHPVTDFVRTGYDSGSLRGHKCLQCLNVVPTFDFMRYPVMTPSQRARRGGEAARDAKWRAAGEQFKLIKNK